MKHYQVALAGVKILTSNNKFFAMAIEYSKLHCFSYCIVVLKFNLVVKIKTFGTVSPLVNAAKHTVVYLVQWFTLQSTH